MKLLLAISRGIDWLSTTIGRITFWLALVLVLVGVYNVVTRYLGGFLRLRLSSNFYLELQTYLYNLMFLLGAAYVLKVNAHVRVDVIYSRLAPKSKAVIDIIGALLFLIPFAVLGFYLSWGYVMRSWQQLEMSPNPGGLPRYPIKTFILVVFAMLILQAISESIKNLAFVRGHENSGSIHAPTSESKAFAEPAEAI